MIPVRVSSASSLAAQTFEAKSSPCLTTTFATPSWLANSTFLRLTPM
jgi:hypothetical protein